jgi:hypothetical protein
MTPDDFRRLVAAGLSTEQIAIVMEMMDRDARAVAEADDARKAKGRERVARWREARNVTETQQNVTVPLTGGAERVEDKSQTTEIEPQLENKKRERSLASGEFDDWYAGYPHKVQRGAAERAFVKARSIASLAELKAGVQRYIAAKPADRHWQNPATWLNGKGWLDQPGVVVPMARGSPATRPVDDLINSLVSQMDEADAKPPTEIEGYSAAPLRLSSRQW